VATKHRFGKKDVGRGDPRKKTDLASQNLLVESKKKKHGRVDSKVEVPGGFCRQKRCRKEKVGKEGEKPVKKHLRENDSNVMYTKRRKCEGIPAGPGVLQAESVVEERLQTGRGAGEETFYWGSTDW